MNADDFAVSLFIKCPNIEWLKVDNTMKENADQFLELLFQPFRQEGEREGVAEEQYLPHLHSLYGRSFSPKAVDAFLDNRKVNNSWLACSSCDLTIF